MKIDDPIIQVDGLGKKYRIGARSHQNQTMRDVIVDSVTSPVKKLRALLRGEAQAAAALSEEMWALKDISFSVQTGQALAIIGNNGAGKSTLLKILSRITEPSCGEAMVKGRVASLLEVGTGFHPELTGRENILLNAAILGMSRQEIAQHFDEIVDFAGVEKFIETPVKHYSSGMYVRLAFSVAAHLNPEVLIIDEVLAVGDVRFQKKCLGKMGEVAGSGRTVIFVSHNLGAVRSLCQRAIYLEHGTLAKDGPVDEVVNYYLSQQGGESQSRSWAADQRPSNGEVSLCDVTLCDPNGSEAVALELASGGQIRIRYELLHQQVHPVFSISLMTDDGSCVFSTLSNSDRNFHGRASAAGEYAVICRVPGDLLNVGRYWVAITFGAPGFHNSATVERAVSIDAVEDGVLRGDYHGAFGGVVRPKLSWEISAVNQPLLIET